MVLMAIDHVRVYSGVPAGSPDMGIFFTRWVTHFCAPGFVFLAGTSAFLYGQNLKSKNGLTKYLLTRGLLLILFELTILRFSWTFNFNYSDFTMAGVVWMLGCCMIIMSLLVRMNITAVTIIGVLVICFQNYFADVPGLFPTSVQHFLKPLYPFVYPSYLQGPKNIFILYVIVPWIGVMATGYGFGRILLLPPEKRKRICIRLGLVLTAIFLIAGTATSNSPKFFENGTAQPFVYKLLNQQKYPASILFLLMTLGPIITLLPLVENAKGWIADKLKIFGKVPLFYYLLHIPLIHLTALMVNWIKYGAPNQNWYEAAPPYVWFQGAGNWGLMLLYSVFIIDVVILYFLCRNYAKYKSLHPEKKWLKYL
jgi:uncharacterized membrane protein